MTASQAGNSLEDEPVIVAVEILRAHAVGDLVPGGAIQHQSTEHGLLGFDGVRRQAQAVGRA